MARLKRFLAAFACTALLGLSGGAGLAADNLAYVFTSTDQFGVVDLNTGAFTQFSNTGQQPAGMGMAGGSLYVATYDYSALYKVNPANGNITLVGHSGITYCNLGSTLSGLYAVDTGGNLYSVNPSTAAATSIGSTGQSCVGNSLGMSTNSNSLYFAVDSNLYTLNTSTGLATLVGPMGVSGLGSMMFEGGLLYAGVTQPSSQIYTLNTSTGAGTPVSTPSGNPSPGKLWGMAPASPQTGSLNLISTRSGLCGNDLINWNQLPPPIATVPTPVSITSNNGVHGTLTANAGAVFSDKQASGFWNGNFGPGDFLVGTGQTVAASPIQIAFPTPVWGVGAQMGYGANGSFLAGISVFGAGNIPLGSYDVSGTESNAGDNSAPFIGVLDSAGGISTVEFFTLSSFGSSPGAFAINEASLNTTGSTLAASSGSPQAAVVDTAFASPLTVRLTDPCGAPLSGVTVAFAAPPSGASATLSAGSAVTGSNGTAAVTASANATTGSYTVTAGVYGLSAGFSLTNVALSSLALSPASVVGGNPTTANTVTLTAAAPASGATIALTSSSPSVAAVPASVTVAGGSTVSSPFSITTTGVGTSTHVTVTASDGTNKKTGILTVKPASLASVKLSPKSVVGGKSTTNNTATLNGLAPAGGDVVSLLSSNPAVAAVPGSVTVAAGAAASPAFTITTTAVAAQTDVTISGTYNGVTKKATLTVDAAQLVSLRLSPTSVKGGRSTTHNTVTLNGPAPAGGAAIALGSGNPAVASVPPTATVAAGATSATFTIRTTTVATDTVVPIGASYDGVTKSENLTVTPAQ
jgi:hypothetical protein